MVRFKNRVQAGQYLAERLPSMQSAPDAVVLGLPRGGVVVAAEVARKLGLPLDIFLVRKLGVPGYEELAMGAIASGGVRVMNEDVLRQIRVSDGAIESVTRKEEQELIRREEAYRGNRPRLDVKGLTVILIDEVSRRGRRCAPRWLPCDGRNQNESSWPFRPRLRIRARNSGRRWMRSSAL